MAEPQDSAGQTGSRRLAYSALAPLVNQTETLWRSRCRLDGETAAEVARLAGTQLDDGTAEAPAASLANAVTETVNLWRKYNVSRAQSAEIAEIACARLEPARSQRTPAPVSLDAQKTPSPVSQKKHCRAITVYGTRCGRPAVGSSDYCRWCLPSHGSA